MAKTRLEHEIEFTVLEQLIRDRAELVVFFQRLRCPGVNEAVVLDPPRIDPALTERTHQFAAGGAGDQ